MPCRPSIFWFFLAVAIHSALTSFAQDKNQLVNINYPSLLSTLLPYPASLGYDSGIIYYYNGTDWVILNNYWQLDGNDNVNENNFIGCNNNYDFNLKTNNLQRMTVKSDGKVGVNTAAPLGQFDILGDVSETDLIPYVNGNYNGYCTFTGVINNAYQTNPFSFYHYLFDNDLSSAWQGERTLDLSQDDNPDVWVIVEFSTPRVLTAYDFTIDSDIPMLSPKEFRLEVSNNGTNWTPLEPMNTVLTSSYEANTTFEKTFNNTTPYKFFKLHIYSSNFTHPAGTNSVSSAYRILDANLYTNPSYFIVSLNGNVGLNQTEPTERLHVNGNITANAFNTPDYVFENYFETEKEQKTSYSFMPLDEVYEFVKTHKHLPNIPSAKTIKQQGGMIVNRATERNLEKIEELYLHLFELKEQAVKLEERIKNIKSP